MIAQNSELLINNDNQNRVYTSHNKSKGIDSPTKKLSISNDIGSNEMYFPYLNNGMANITNDMRDKNKSVLQLGNDSLTSKHGNQRRIANMSEFK